MDAKTPQMTVGNVTTTTVRGLVPGRMHAFWVRGLSENRSDPAAEQVDLYGRREPLPGAVVGYFGEASSLVATLEEDILFDRCDRFGGEGRTRQPSSLSVSSLSSAWFCVGLPFVLCVRTCCRSMGGILTQYFRVRLVDCDCMHIALENTRGALCRGTSTREL